MPTISANLIEDTKITTSGTYNTAYAKAGTFTGFYGYLVLSGGTWTYYLYNQNANVQALAQDQIVNESFTISGSSGTTIFNITVKGTDDAPVITGTSGGGVVEAGGVNNAMSATPTASGTLSVSDVDNPNSANTFTAVSTATATSTGYGTYTMTAAGVWTYTLNNNNTAVQALNVGSTLTDTFTVTSTNGASKVITITINGTNDAAVISGTSNSSVTEAGGVNNGTRVGGPYISGILTSTDVDNPANSFKAVGTTASTGGYGTYSMTAAGVWTYTLNNNHTAVQSLNVGSNLTDTFTVASIDGTQQVISITIRGANDAAVISGASSGTVVEASGVNNGTPGTPTVSGTLTSTDVDNVVDPANSFIAVSTATGTQYGSYTMTAGGVWTYILNNDNTAVQSLNVGGTLTDTFTVTTIDGTQKVITITIQGTNDTAAITGVYDGIVVEAGGVNNTTPGTPTVSGTLSNGDVDNPKTFTAVSTAASTQYGSYTMTAAGVWTYTLDNNNAGVQGLNVGHTLFDTFTVTATDGTEQVITITINGTDDAAVISGKSDGTVVEAGGVNNGTPGTSTVSGTLYVTDVDSSTGFGNNFTAVSTAASTQYGSYTMTAGGVWNYFLDNSNTDVQRLNVGGTLTDTFTVTAMDGTQQVITITINGTNDTAAITGNSSGIVVEAGGVNNATVGTPTVSDTLYITDVDNPASFTAVSTATNTSYGSYTMTAGGVWNYFLDNSNTDVQHLNVGSTLTDTFTVTAMDGTQKVVTITINGTDDTAVISGSSSGTVVEAGGVNNGTPGTSTVSGTLSFADVDNVVDPANSFIAVSTATSTRYGSYTMTAAGVWTYILNNNNTDVQRLNVGGQLTDTFTITAVDGTTQVINIAIHGSNDTSVISGSKASLLVEAGGVNNGTPGTSTISKKLSFTDVDNVVDPANSFIAVSSTTASKGYGSYTMTAGGVWTYVLNNNNAAVQALNAYQALTDVFTVTAIDGTTYQISIIIHGTDDTAVITGNSVGEVVEAGGENNGTPGTSTISGTLSLADVDNVVDPANSFRAVSTAASTQYGSYTITAAGVWTYTLDNNNAGVQGLNVGHTLIDTFTVTATDGTQQVISITIHGSNDAAVIFVSSNRTVVEAGGVNNATAGTPTVSGTLYVTDVDSSTGFGNNFTAVSTATNTSYGSYTMTAEGVWNYFLDNSNTAVQALNVGSTLTDTFTVTAMDGTQKVVTITINGANDAAAISGASGGTVVEAGGVKNGTLRTPTVSGTLTSQDRDNPANTFTAVSTATATNTGYGSYTMTADGVWTYILNNNNTAVQSLNVVDTVIDTFTVTAIDGTTQIITITIDGTNDAAAISGKSDGTVVEAGGVNNATAGTPTASGTLSITDVDDDVDPANSFRAVSTATNTSYGSYTMTAAGVWTYTLDNSNTTVQGLGVGSTLTDTFTVTAIDGTTQTVTVTIQGGNDAPVGQDVSVAMNEDTTFVLEVTYVNSEFGTQAGYPVNAVRIDNIPLASVGKLTYGPNNQVVDAAHNVLTEDEFKTLIFTPNLFPPSLFGLTDLDVGDALGGVRIDTLPDAQTQGKLFLNGQAVAAGTTISVAELSNLTFVPVEYFSGSVTFGFTVQDSHGAYAAARNTATIAIAAINNAPTIEAPLITYTYTSGGADGQGSLLSGIQFADADSGTGDVTATLSIMGGGRLVATAQSGVVVNTSSDGLTMTLTGSIQNINNLMKTGVRYIAPDIVNQTRTATATLREDGNISLVMTTNSGVFYADETLIPVDASGAKLITITGQNTSTITLVGKKSDIDRYVNTLNGVVNDNVAYLSTVINDNGNTGIDPGFSGSSTSEENETISAIAIQRLNEIAKSDVSDSTTEVLSGAATFTGGGSIWAAINSRAQYLRRRFFRNGDVVNPSEQRPLIRQNPSISRSSLIGPTATSGCTYTKVAVVALATLILAAVGVGVGIAISDDDDDDDDTSNNGNNNNGNGNNNPTTETVNTAPEIVRPAQFTLDEDAQEFNLTGISFKDNNSSSTTTIEVSFTVSAGTLTATLPDGISLQSGSTASKMIWRGSISKIDNFLLTGSGLRYTPAANANDNLNSVVKLTIFVNDLGNTGTGGSKTDTEEVDLHITPVADVVRIDGDITGEVSDHVNVDAEGMLTVSGRLTVVDVDVLTNEARFVAPDASALQGTYGVFTFNTTGSPSDATYGTWTYKAENAQTAIQQLNVGDTITDTLTVHSANGGASQTITITIKGTNDAPIAVADTATAIEAGGVHNATPGINPTGNVLTNDTDVDRGDTKTVNAVNAITIDPITQETAVTAGTVGVALKGRYGSLVLNANGSYTYTVDNTNAAVDALADEYDTLTDIFRYTVRDKAGATSTNTLTITIQGANDAPIAIVDTATAVEASGVHNATPGTNPTGNVLTNDKDVDHDDTETISAVNVITIDPTTQNTVVTAGTVGVALNGRYGSLVLNANGSYTYTVDNANAAVDALNVGDTLTDTYTYTVTDAAGATASCTLTVTINGANDAADITEPIIGIVVEDGGVSSSVSGTLTSKDVDNADTFTAVSTATVSKGGYGTYTITTAGVWTYTLNEANELVNHLNVGGILIDTFTVTTIDGTPKTISITIRGTNDAASISGVYAFEIEELGDVDPDGAPGVTTITAKLFSDDVDNPDNTFTAVSTPAVSKGGYGTYTITADGVWTYTLNNHNTVVNHLNVNDILTDSFTVTTIDGTQRVVTITIRGTNDTAAITGVYEGIVVEAGGVNDATPGTPAISGTLINGDVDNPKTFTAVSTATVSTGGYGTYTITTAGVWTYTLDEANEAVSRLNVGNTLTDTFTVTAADGTEKIVTITINGSNDAPTISGGTSDETYTQNADYSAAKTTTIIGNAFTLADIDSSKLNQLVLKLTNYKVGDTLVFNPYNTYLPAGLTIVQTADTITITGAATIAEYQKLLSLISFSNSLPNPDATTRQVTLTVRDEQGASSVLASAALKVVSPLSTRIAEFVTAQEASANAIQSGAADVVTKMLALMMARNNLAQEVHNVLVFSKEQSNVLQQVGDSLKDALDKLGIDADYAAGTLTQTQSSLLGKTANVLFQKDTGGLIMSDTTQALLLSVVNQVISETRQDWYRELTHWLDTGVKQSDGTYLWSATTANAAMAKLLGGLYTGSSVVIPGITHTANAVSTGVEYIPVEEVAEGEPGALNVYDSGALTLSATQLQDVRQRLDLVRLIATNPGATNAQLALMALALVPTYPGADCLYRADQLLELLLTNAGIADANHTLNATQLSYLPTGHATPATLTDGGITEWTTVDGLLVFTEATRMALIQQLSDKITLETRLLQDLQDALQTTKADAHTGKYTVTQAMVDLLASLGVYAATTAGTKTGEYLLSADMRDRVVAQLVAIGPMQVKTDGLALSVDLSALNSLNAAKNAAEVTLNSDTAISAVTFKTLTATAEVVKLLQKLGITIDSVQRYADMGMQSVLDARVLAGKANGSTTVYRKTVKNSSGTITSDDLYLPEPVFRTVYDLLSLEYSQSGLTTKDTYPLQTSYTAPTVSTAPQDLVDATQPSSLFDVLEAISNTSFVIQELLAIDTTAPDIIVGTSSTFNALKLGMDWKLFVQTLADAGLSQTNLGSIADYSKWTAAQKTQFDTAGAFAYTEEGEVVMTAAAVNKLLGSTALAQYFEQRSELAHHAFGLLTKAEPSDGLVVVNGTSTANATTLSRQSAAALGVADGGNTNSMGLVAVSTATLLELQKLGITLPTITARGTQFTQAQINAAKGNSATMLLDETDGTYWMRIDTRNNLLRDVAAQMQSSLQLANLLDATNHPADTANIVSKAVAVKSVLNTTDASSQVETLTLTTAQLTELHLVFTVGTDVSLVSTAALGTVFVVNDNGTTKLTMSSATKHWLYLQANAVADATFTSATDAAAVAQAFITANQRLQVLAGAVSLGNDQPIVIHASASFKAWIQSQSSAAQQLGNFSDLTTPTGKTALTKEQIQALFTTNGSYAIDGDDIRTSLATLKLWQAAAAKAAADAVGKGDLFTDPSLDTLISTGADANDTNNIAKFSAEITLADAKAATQTAIFADTPVASSVQTVFLEQITLQDTQLAAIEQELLDELVPTWAVSSATDGTGGGYVFLIRKETLDLLGQILPKLKELGIDDLGTTSTGDHIISASTRLALLSYLASVRETYSPILGRTAHTNADSVSLLATLNAAGELVDTDGLVTLDGANASLLVGAVMKLGAANSYQDTALGRQQLLKAALGTVQIDSAGKLHMTLDTLRLLQAEVTGWIEGTAASALLSSTELMAAVAINNMLDVAGTVTKQTMFFDVIPGIKVSSALIAQAASLGITLHLIDSTNASTVAAALSDGSAMQLGAYTIVGGEIVISTDTVAWLEKITRERVQDTVGALDLSSQLITINPLNRWTAEPDYETLMTQLATGTAISDANLATYGANALKFGNALPVTDATSTLALLQAASPYLDSGLVHQVSGTTLQDGDYAVLADGSVIMTQATAALITAALINADQRQLLQESRTIFNTLISTFNGKGALADTNLLQIDADDLPSYVVDGLINVSELKVYSKAEEDAGASPIATSSAAAVKPSHSVSWETLQSAEKAYHAKLDAAILATPNIALSDIDFGVLTVNGVVYSVKSLHSAYLSLQSGANVYVKDADGNYIMSGGARDRVLESVATSIETLQHNAARDLISMLGTDDTVLTIQSGAEFKRLLQQLLVTPYYTTDMSKVDLDHALVYNATTGTYTMSAATRKYLLSQAQQNLAKQNEEAIQDAVDDLAMAYGVSSLADFIKTNNQWVYDNVPLLAHDADDNNPATASKADKYVVALKFDASLYAALTGTGGVFAVTTPSTLGTSAATKYDSLYTKGNIAFDAVNHVIYMSAETYAEKLSQLPVNADSNLVCINEATFADTLFVDNLDKNRDWVSYHLVTSLGGKTSFNDNLSLSKALNAQPEGTIFKDSRGMYWMSKQTATALTAALAAAQSVDDSAIELTTADKLDAASATLLAAFASDVAPTTHAVYYKAYALTAAQVSSLHTLGIDLNLASTTLEAWQAPPLSTYVVDSTSGEIWVSAETFEFLGEQLKGVDAWNNAVTSQQANGSSANRRLKHTPETESLITEISEEVDLYNLMENFSHFMDAKLEETSSPLIYKVSNSSWIADIIGSGLVTASAGRINLTNKTDFTLADREAFKMVNNLAKQHVAYDTDGNLLISQDVLNYILNQPNHPASLDELLDDKSALDTVYAIPDVVSFVRAYPVQKYLESDGFSGGNFTQNSLTSLTNEQLEYLNSSTAKHYYLTQTGSSKEPVRVIMSKAAYQEEIKKIQSDRNSAVKKIATALIENESGWVLEEDGNTNLVTLDGDTNYWKKIFDIADPSLQSMLLDSPDKLKSSTWAPFFYASGGPGKTIITKDALYKLLAWANYYRSVESTSIPTNWPTSIPTNWPTYLPTLSPTLYPTLDPFNTLWPTKQVGTYVPYKPYEYPAVFPLSGSIIRNFYVALTTVRMMLLPGTGLGPWTAIIDSGAFKGMAEKFKEIMKLFEETEKAIRDTEAELLILGHDANPTEAAKRMRPLETKLNDLREKLNAQEFGADTKQIYELILNAPIKYEAKANFLNAWGTIFTSFRVLSSYLSIIPIAVQLYTYDLYEDTTKLAKLNLYSGVYTLLSANQFVFKAIAELLIDPDRVAGWKDYVSLDLYKYFQRNEEAFAQLITADTTLLQKFGALFVSPWKVGSLSGNAFEGVINNLIAQYHDNPGILGVLAKYKAAVSPTNDLYRDIWNTKWSTEMMRVLNTETNTWSFNWDWKAFRKAANPGLVNVGYLISDVGLVVASTLVWYEFDDLQKHNTGEINIIDNEVLKINALLKNTTAVYNMTQLIESLEDYSAKKKALQIENGNYDVGKYQTYFDMVTGALFFIGDAISTAPGVWLLYSLYSRVHPNALEGEKAKFALLKSNLIASYSLAIGVLIIPINSALSWIQKGAINLGTIFNPIFTPLLMLGAILAAPSGISRDSPDFNRKMWRMRITTYGLTLLGFGIPVWPSYDKETGKWTGVDVDAWSHMPFIAYNNWVDLVALSKQRKLGSDSDSDPDVSTQLLTAAVLSSATSLAVLQRAKDAGVDANYYEILAATSLENGVQSYGVLAYHVLAGELNIAALATQSNSKTFTVKLSNTTGGLATYYIAAEDADVTNPYVDVDVSESSKLSTNRFIVGNTHAIIHGGDSLEIYHLFQALDTVADSSDATKAVAGYIVDGFGANMGRDMVVFDLAQSGQIIHAGTTYNGLVSYKGIYNFVGSAYNDTFTRYGFLAQDNAWVNYVGGGGTDVFDLREGNNSVTLNSGVVMLNGTATPGANTSTDITPYINNITATNKNDVTLLVSDDATQWFEVYGNALSSDSIGVASTKKDQGLYLSNYSKNPSAVAHLGTTTNWGVHDGYVLSRYINGAAGSQFGFFDTNIDAFYGSLFADYISLDSTSTLKVVDGMGGADTIDVNVAGIEVTGGGENSLVRLRGNAHNATVYANAGNAVLVEGASNVTVYAEDNATKVATSVDLQLAANATVNAGMGSQVAVKQATSQTTVNIDWFGANDDFAGKWFKVLPDDEGVTTVTSAADSSGQLVVNANDGFAKLKMGGQSGQTTRVNVGTKMDTLWAIADQANALFLDLYFDAPDVTDSVADLQSLATGGVAGKLQKSALDATTGLYTFSGAWKHGDTSTLLSLSFADAAKVNLHFGSGATATTVNLATIVA